MEQLQQMGMSRERIEQMRNKIQQNMQGIEQQINQFAGERIAENMSEQPPGESMDNLMNRPFHALSDADKKILQREVKRLAAALRTRIALRQKRAKSGQLDPKATIRANLKYHGVPMEIPPRPTRKPKIVVICDISTSMRFCSELMLSFLFALQGQVRKTHAFAFIDHLEYISEDFNGSNADEAIASVMAHAQRTLQHRPGLVAERFQRTNTWTRSTGRRLSSSSAMDATTTTIRAWTFSR
jgi:uncharacterized protein